MPMLNDCCCCFGWICLLVPICSVCKLARGARSEVIQIGLTFADGHGNRPPNISTWQFNFSFDLVSAAGPMEPAARHLRLPLRAGLRRVHLRRSGS